MNDLAERYVRVVLALGLHDEDYVDAYYGPPEWRAAAGQERLPLDVIRRDAHSLATEVQRAAPVVDAPLIERQRHVVLTKQLMALSARADHLAGRRFSFDEESRLLYDAVAPTHTEDQLAATVTALESVVPGQGPLQERLPAFRRAFTIPTDRLDAVFSAAIAACRARTQHHLSLPSDERFTVEYVTGKSWSGYNWYQGGATSLIQVNTDLPIFLNRAVDLACHEGYPGHHVYDALLEHHLVNERGWVEYAVYPLFSPMSLVAEGTANYGIEVAFPGDERLRFERDVLFPLAGLDGSQAALYARVESLTTELTYAGNEAARRYLDGHLSAEETVNWLVKYTLTEPERAQQRLRFIDQYRAYVINYNLGKDLIARHVERQGGSAITTPERRWGAFSKLLMTPQVPSTLDLDTTLESSPL